MGEGADEAAMQGQAGERQMGRSGGPDEGRAWTRGGRHDGAVTEDGLTRGLGDLPQPRRDRAMCHAVGSRGTPTLRPGPLPLLSVSRDARRSLSSLGWGATPAPPCRHAQSAVPRSLTLLASLESPRCPRPLSAP